MTATPTRTHDPLCPTRVVGHQCNTACWCDEIARVREDERATFVVALATDLTSLADSLSPVGDTRSFADTVIADAYRWVARAVSNGSMPRRT